MALRKFKEFIRDRRETRFKTIGAERFGRGDG